MFGKEKQLRRALWTHVATTLGGTHTFAEGLAVEESIDVTIDGVAVRLDTYAIATGKVIQVYTRVAAPFQFGPGTKMQVYAEGVFQKLGKLLGAQDVELGHPELDPKLVVKAESPAVARRLWTAATLRMFDALAPAMITSTHESITVIEPGIWDVEAKLRGGIALIAALAARDIYGAKVLGELGHVIQRTGERPRAELDTGVRVLVGAEDRDGRLVMAARGDPLALDGSIEIVDGRAEVALPQAAHVFLRDVGTGTLAHDGFVWHDLELDPARLRAGAALLGALATAADGIYR